jgi:hypothetical protein
MAWILFLNFKNYKKNYKKLIKMAPLKIDSLVFEIS